jgi:hypothetical protein
MLARLDLSHVRKRSNEPNGSVSAHSQVTDVIEEDDAGSAGRITRFAQQSSHYDVGPSRLVDYG